ncbi:MAG: hypothetical protein IIY55_10320 [Blautia sp.]|nr:hypothetical protein [Blautia sp.]
MTESCIRSISPDGLTGIIFALEGMKKTIVLFNGPMGCRFYHSTTSGFLVMRPLLYLPVNEKGERAPVDYNYLNDWFFRQDRVPCTYLDGYDYVYGTRDKVREALLFIRENIDFDLLGIVNSPGAALIGDNLLEIARQTLGGSRVVMLESPGYSISFEEGYSEAAYALLSQVAAPFWKGQETDFAVSRNVAGISQMSSDNNEGAYKASINLLGISIWNRYFEGDIKELKRLFSLCRIEVNAVLCADSSLEELYSMPDADLNVVLDPEMGLLAAKYMEEEFSVPFYVCDTLPIGFSATEKMMREVCARLEEISSSGRTEKAASPIQTEIHPEFPGTACHFRTAQKAAPFVSSLDTFTEEMEKARALAFYKINGIYQMYGKPRGVSFCVVGNTARKKAYTSFLTTYLGMEETDAGHAELLFSNANVISEMMLKNRTFCGIEIELPGMGYVDLTLKTHLGIEGTLLLIEQVLNGIMSRL